MKGLFNKVYDLNKAIQMKLSGCSACGVAMVIFILLNAISSFAQPVSIILRADSEQIQIGDPLQFRITLKHPSNLPVTFPHLADTLGNLELISVSKIDTTVEGSNQLLSQRCIVSAYDSGEYHAGPLKVFFKNSLGESDSSVSNDIPVLVNTLDVDTSKPFKAIKAPLDVPYSWREFIPFIAAGILLYILVVAGIIFWYKYSKRKPVVVNRPRPKEPAHIWARRELEKLEQEKLWQHDQVKSYYSRLTDILRLYLEYRYGWYAMESTTEEIQSVIGNYNLKEKAKENLLSILLDADLVKFAKMIPLPDVNIRVMERAYKFIDFSEPGPSPQTPPDKIGINSGGLKTKDNTI